MEEASKETIRLHSFSLVKESQICFELHTTWGRTLEVLHRGSRVPSPSPSSVLVKFEWKMLPPGSSSWLEQIASNYGLLSVLNIFWKPSFRDRTKLLRVLLLPQCK